MTVWTLIGNCPKFAFTPKPEVKKHYSSMSGTKKLDKIAFVSVEAEVEVHCDEFVQDNLVMGLLGEVNSSNAIEILGAPTVERQLKLDGTNNFGARVEVILPHVFFYSDKVLDLIGDDWGDINLTGEVLSDLRSDMSSPFGFGTVTFLSALNGQPLSPPNTLNYFIGKGLVYTAPLNLS
jgi:hypothetical protein